MSPDEEAQNDEILALSSIYENDFIVSENKDKELPESNLVKGGELRIHVELPEGFHILHKQSGSSNDQKYQIEHLPPIVLNFMFPPDYPSHGPPKYTVSTQWLTPHQLSLLCCKMDDLWKENCGCEIMFTWCQFIKEETLSFFKIEKHLDLSHVLPLPPPQKNSKIPSEPTNDTSYIESSSEQVNSEPLLTLDERAIQNVAFNSNIFRILREHDEEMRKKIFNTKVFECKVCFLDKSGANCIEFWPCSHIYCKSCMRTYFEVQINEGNIKCLKCPEESCQSDANPKQVEELVSEELYSKWDELLLSSTLSSIEGIQRCPRKHCQYPVTVEENQGQCPSCSFVFCGLCRFGWHGLEKCRFKGTDAGKMLDEYQNGSVETKKSLEARYGKKYLTSLLNEYLTISFIGENTKGCPRCKSSIEKIDGCNKMTCKRCGINFCWLCECVLDNLKPYYHFNDPKSPCFNLLFQGAFFEDENEDLEFFEEEEEDGMHGLMFD